MKRSVAWLVVTLPVLSLAVGALLFYLAYSNPDPAVEQLAAPLSKTSWQDEP